MKVIHPQHSVLNDGNTVLQCPSLLTFCIVISVSLKWLCYLYQMCFQSPALKVISNLKKLTLFIYKCKPGSIIKSIQRNISERNMGNCQVNSLEYWDENVSGKMYLVTYRKSVFCLLIFLIFQPSDLYSSVSHQTHLHLQL